jgi:glutamate synthase domain-containing protein 3
VGHIVGAPPARPQERDDAEQRRLFAPKRRGGEESALTVVGNTFAYGARAGRACIAGRGGNRCGICLRRSHEADGPRVVVEGVEANAFQYMTGGAAGAAEVQQLLREHCAETASRTAAGLLRSFDPARFARVTTAIAAEAIE